MAGISPLLVPALTSPKTATQLAQEFPITRQGITKHLNRLALAGLVQAQPIGREKRYSFTPEPLHSVSEWIEAIGVKWDERLQRLKMLDCWNRRDAGDLAALFDEDGYVVGFDGSPMNGRVEIESVIHQIFADH